MAIAKQQTLYIKPRTWAGKLEYFIGSEPSRPDVHSCDRLGRYFIIVRDIESARSIARAHAHNVIECEHYVGFEWPTQPE